MAPRYTQSGDLRKRFAGARSIGRKRGIALAHGFVAYRRQDAGHPSV